MELPPRSASPLAAASRVEPVIASGAELAAGKSGGGRQPEQLYSSSADEMQAQEVSSGSRRKKKTKARDPPEEKKVPDSYLPGLRIRITTVRIRIHLFPYCGPGSDFSLFEISVKFWVVKPTISTIRKKQLKILKYILQKCRRIIFYTYYPLNPYNFLKKSS